MRQHIYGAPHLAFVDTAGGLLDVAESELRAIAGEIASRQKSPEEPLRPARRDGGLIVREAEYRALLEVVMRATTLHDIRLEIVKGEAHNPRELDALLAAIPWAAYFPPGSAVEVRADSAASTLYHEGLIEERATVSLVEAGCSVVPRGADEGASADSAQRLRLTMERNRISVTLSLAGAPLWRRGYRASFSAVAPLREDLAQAAIRSALSQAEGAPDALLLPFAGSGTLLFESLIRLFEIPPFLFGRTYAFESFAFGAPPSVDWLRRALREALSARLLDRSASAPPFKAVLIDSHSEAVEAAAANWRRFGQVGNLPVEAAFRDMDAFSAPWGSYLPPEARRLFLPLNPPYGRRLPVSASTGLYRRIGRECEGLARSLGAAGGGLSGFILCPNEASWRSFLESTPSLRKTTSHFGQGGLDIRVCAFA